MPYVLNKLTNANYATVKKQLEKDSIKHAKLGMHLEHIWKNADDESEVYFLFKVADLQRHKKQMQAIHTQARKQHPDIIMPVKIYLEEL